MIRRLLTVGVLGSILSATVTLWTGHENLAMASFVALAVFSSAFGWVGDDSLEKSNA